MRPGLSLPPSALAAARSGASPQPDARALRGDLLVAAAGLALIALAYRATLGSMVDSWSRTATFQHGFAVFPIVLWLVWRGRRALAAVPREPFWPGVALAGAAGVLWLLSELGLVKVGAQLGLILMMQSLVLTAFGLAAARTLAFPLAFLFFAVPMGEFMVPALIDVTADLAVAGVRACGIPLYRDGNEFMTPAGSWSVIEACSGIRYLIASLTGGTLYAYLIYRSLLRRVVFIGCSIVVPILANGLRAFGIVLLAQLSGHATAARVDHLLYGWFFFAAVTLLLFGIGSLWREDHSAADPGSAPPGPARAGRPRAGGRNLLYAALAALSAAILWRGLDAAVESAQAAPASTSLAPVAGRSGWTPSEPPPGDWAPKFTGYSSEVHQWFERGSDRAAVRIRYYGEQDWDHQLVTSTNALASLDDPRWRQVGGGLLQMDWAGRPVSLRRAELFDGVQRIEVLFGYWIDGRVTADEVPAKLALVWSKLRLRGDGAAAVFVYARAGDGSGRPAGAAGALAHDLSSEIDRVLNRPDPPAAGGAASPAVLTVSTAPCREPGARASFAADGSGAFPASSCGP